MLHKAYIQFYQPKIYLKSMTTWFQHLNNLPFPNYFNFRAKKSQHRRVVNSKMKYFGINTTRSIIQHFARCVRCCPIATRFLHDQMDYNFKTGIFPKSWDFSLLSIEIHIQKAKLQRVTKGIKTVKFSSMDHLCEIKVIHKMLFY